MAAEAGTAAIGAAGAGGVNKWLVTLSIVLGTIMATIDTSVVNIALVHIQASFGATIQGVTWVTTSYLIAVALVLPLTAWLSSVLGRTRMYHLSVVLFTVASALSGFHRTLRQRIGFRVIQRLCVELHQPVSN